MERLFVLLVAISFLCTPMVSCASKPMPEDITVSFEAHPEKSTTVAVVVEQTKKEPAKKEAETELKGIIFDPSSISPEMFDTTKINIQHLITDLNLIIRSRSYHTWLSYLGKAYLDKISSAEFLTAVSSLPYLKNKKITLTDARDYFNRVVVPSRANDRVDDISFVSPQRIKVYTITAKGERLRLYDLENLGDGWKIIN